jgi:O-acetyl-ADP-ribose deacetylase (regulator of RNase III)
MSEITLHTQCRTMLRLVIQRIRRMRMRTIKPFGRGFPSGLLRVSLCDQNPEVARALMGSFHDVRGVEVLEGDLLHLDCDAVVSPANSFAYMDGGIDQHIDRFYEGEAQRAVLARIAERFYGELPVGVAMIIDMTSRRFPFLIVSPTMRVPGDDISGTINAYLALRAALAAVLNHNLGGKRRIGSLASPGLGTGVGGMPPGESARQMRAAYDMIVGGGWKQIQHPAQAPFVMPTLPTTGRPAGGGRT